MLSWLDQAYKDPEYAEQMKFMETQVDDEMSRAMDEFKVADGENQQCDQDANSKATVEAELVVDDEDDDGGPKKSFKKPMKQGYADIDEGYVADSERLVAGSEDKETP